MAIRISDTPGEHVGPENGYTVISHTRGAVAVIKPTGKNGTAVTLSWNDAEGNRTRTFATLASCNEWCRENEHTLSLPVVEPEVPAR